MKSKSFRTTEEMCSEAPCPQAVVLLDPNLLLPKTVVTTEKILSELS